MTRIGKTIAAVCGVLVLLLASTPLLAPAPAYAVTDDWASWSPITGTSNNYALSMQQTASGFPAASVASDSRANVQVPSGVSTFQGPSTPPGAKYGTSLGSPYLVLRPRADNATSPSTTTYTFEAPTPDTGWAFVLGDVDADQVQVRALDAAGVPVPAPVVDGWFRSAYNSAGGTDVPTWAAGTSTLTGNPAASDTDGATGWFEPDVRLSSLTFVFTRRAGFPVYQTWFVSRARPLGGVVADVSTVGSCPVQGTVLTLVSPAGAELATTSPSPTGAYAFGEWATQAGYTVRLSAPAGCAIVGPASATLDNRGNDGSPGSRAGFAVRQVVPQPISGTVTDTGGTPVPDVAVTLTRPDSSTVALTTGPDGGYLFDDNPVGPGYAVAVSVPAGYAPGPGGTTITGLEVAAAPITGQDFQLRALAVVSGRVTGGGSGLGGVPVTLIPAGGGPTLGNVTAGDGSYAFAGVDPGDVTIAIVPPPGYTGPAARPATVGAADLGGQDFALSRPGGASGAVTDSGEGVGGVAVTLDGPGGSRVATTDAQGSWLVDGLAAGTYAVTIAPPAGLVVAGATPLTFAVTAAGELRGGLDFALVAAPVAPVTSPTPSATPTAAPSPSTSAAPTRTAEPTPSASPTATSTTSTTPADARVLPDTGGPSTLLPAMAGVLIVAGALLIGSARRGRGRTGS